MIRTRAWLLAPLLALLLAGCAPSQPEPTPSGFTVSPVSASASGTPTASVSLVLPAPSALPANSAWFTSAGHGVKFALPSAWAMFDLTRFNDPAVKAALAPLAEAAGKSLDEYLADLTLYNDLIITGPARGPYSPTASSRKEEAEALGPTPTVESAQTKLAALKATVTAVNPSVTPLGAGYTILFTRPGDTTGQVLACGLLALPSAKGTFFQLDIESDSTTERDALVAGVLATLQKA